MIDGIYILAMLYFIFKMFFYSAYVSGFPDEIEHISYIAYLQSSGRIIPEFKDMAVLKFENQSDSAKNNVLKPSYVYVGMVMSGSFNYLCHPPLYYHIMRMSGGIFLDKDKVFHVNLFRLRAFSMLLAALAIALLFYLGRTRISLQPAIHLLYAVICVSIPMMSYCCAGVSNDTMSLLCFTIFSFGIVRFLEGKRNTVTSLLVAFGLCGSFLSKLTAGMIAFFTAVILVLYIIFKEKSIKFFISKPFIATIPIYILTLSYFFIVKRQTGSFQPTFAMLSPKRFFKSGFFTPAYRGTMNLSQYFFYYSKHFEMTWTGIASHISLAKSGCFWDIDKIAILFAAVLPLAVLIVKANNKIIIMVKIAVVAIIITLVCQFYHAYYEFQNFSGYMGGFQSRYYLCTIFVFAYGSSYFAEVLYGSDNSDKSCKNPKSAAIKTSLRHIAVNAGCIIYSVLLIYEDFIYFILNYHKYVM